MVQLRFKPLEYLTTAMCILKPVKGKSLPICFQTCILIPKPIRFHDRLQANSRHRIVQLFSFCLEA